MTRGERKSDGREPPVYKIPWDCYGHKICDDGKTFYISNDSCFCCEL